MTLDLDRMARGAEKSVKAEFVDVWRTMQEKYADLALLERALAERRSNLIQSDLPWQGLTNALYVEYRRILLRLFERGGQAQFDALIRKADKPSSFSLDHPEAEKWARTYAGRLVQGLTEQSRLAMAEAIAEFIRLQIPPAEGARILRRMLGLTPRSVQAVVRFQQGLRQRGFAEDYIRGKAEEYSRRLLNYRSRVVARTETLRALQEGQRQSFTQAVEQGVLQPNRTRRQWVTAADERTCAICAPMDGQLTTLDDPWQTSEGPVQIPTDTHPQCFPEGQLVTASPLVVGATKRWYSGELVAIETARGYHLSCTPNHPVLTRGGWVPAGLLQPADGVVCHGFGQPEVVASDRDDQHMPTRIEEVAGAFGESFGVTARHVPTTPEDFHGDGMEGQVAVVWADRFLGDGDHPSVDKPPLDGGLVGRGVRDSLFPRPCDRHAMLLGVGLPPHRVVGRSDLSHSATSIHLAPLQELGFGLGSGGNAVLQQDAADNGTADVEALADEIFRHTGEVQVDYVSRITRSPFEGHVYNLQTEGGWYAVGNIITHNCRCQSVLVFPDASGKFPTRNPRPTDTGQPLRPRTLKPRVRREP